ncbi:MAG: helix-turn-helix domain-containing protein [Candidatus Staskawiczbacteria bacterium]|nr:helix-turn-helix domain-containing protein [Candidatus Staskawiczbacteria bacterium]
MAKLNIQDESGDKDFFTMLPNFVLNHSNAIDQALYCQMKRFAGEDGKCFATEQTLCKKLGIGRRSYWKSRDYLLKRGWISFIGMTGSKTRPVKTYKINNIWQENSDYYKKISAESNISLEKDSCQKERDKCQMQHKISAEKHIEEEPYKEEPIKKSISKEIQAKPETFGNSNLNEILEYLKKKAGWIDGSKLSQRRYAKLFFVRMKNFLKEANRSTEDKFVVASCKRLIDLASEDKFHSQNIGKIKYLSDNIGTIARKKATGGTTIEERRA